MSREIKFRVICDFDDEKGDCKSGMVYFGVATFDNGLFCWPHNEGKISHINSYESPLMQYTGLKDRYGKEIYEGDILKGFSEMTPVYKILWNETSPRLYGKISESFYEWGSLERFFEIAPRYGEIEVIGNIYENPELL